MWEGGRGEGGERAIRAWRLPIDVYFGKFCFSTDTLLLYSLIAPQSIASNVARNFVQIM